jgi:hypothetical protein
MAAALQHSEAELGHLRPIEPVDDESGLPPIADELLRHGER